MFVAATVNQVDTMNVVKNDTKDRTTLRDVRIVMNQVTTTISLDVILAISR
jgi:hypothetical protein